LQLGDEFGFVLAPREGAGPIGHGVPRIECWATQETEPGSQP
jgi:hypothetical protein